MSTYDAAHLARDSNTDDPFRRRQGHATIQRLFDAANAHGLKFPKIELMTRNCSVVVLHRAGPKSKFYGLIVATDDGRYPDSTFYGRYDLGGYPLVSYAPDDVRDLMRRFVNDPFGTIFDCGALTGNCCFCRYRLSDERSTAHGYGPVCARNFGLPWRAKRGYAGWQKDEVTKQREIYEQQFVAPRVA